MKNRAKCKLCNKIIESFMTTDYVSCECGEIAVGGGTSHFECSAKNWDNFLRVDDDGNIIVPKIQDMHDKTIKDTVTEYEKALFDPPTPTRLELLDILDTMREGISNLPEHAYYAAVTHADFASLLMLLSAILRAK